MHAGTGDPLVGRLIDRRYEVRSRIARGGMATVYEATDLRLDRRVALKIMHAHLADESQFRERFIQEARSAARLAHPNVVNVFDQGEDGEMAYLVMEYLPSITLRDLLLERGSVTPDQAMDVLEAVLSGLGAAHKAGIVHRDLKPENILLANDGRIKIGDFGLARAVTANTATGKALLGTIAYLSPELLTRGIADTRSDIYAVGIMLFEMLTGKQPFTGEQPMQIAYQHANNSVPLPSASIAGVPRAMDQLVAWSTHRDPNLRPADAREMLEEVQRIRQAGLGEAELEGTKVLPRADDQVTDVIGARPATRRLAPAARPAPAAAPATTGGAAATGLRAATLRRRRTALLWTSLILIVALIVAGLGWWFNFGPGGRIMVPDSAGQDPASVVANLTELGFVVDETFGEAYNYDVEAGLTSHTDPPSGSMLLRGDTIQVVVSLGREQLPPPVIEGLDVPSAEQVVEDDGFTLASDDPLLWFSNAHEADTVITAILADGTNVATLETIEERTELRLVVSAGGLPIDPDDLAGVTEARAQELIEGADLVFSRDEAYDSTVPEGEVISVTYPESPFGPGQTVTVVVSLGPPLVAVPDLTGMSINAAVAAVTAVGLTPDLQTNVSPRALWDVPNLVQFAVTPGSGEFVPEGSTVTIDATLSD